MNDPNRKVPDLYFKVVDPKVQVADLKAEVEELRSGGIHPNLTPVNIDILSLTVCYLLFSRPKWISCKLTSQPMPAFTMQKNKIAYIFQKMELEIAKHIFLQ